MSVKLDVNKVNIVHGANIHSGAGFFGVIRQQPISTAKEGVLESASALGFNLDNPTPEVANIPRASN